MSSRQVHNQQPQQQEMSPIRHPGEALLAGADLNSSLDLEEGAAKDRQGKQYFNYTGGRILPRNHLTAREMDSIVALCDTLLPSIDLHSNDQHVRALGVNSASMLGTPEVFGRYISGKFEHAMLWLLRMSLWLLSTWYGTFVLSGMRNVTCNFPYLHKFSKLDLKRREEIMFSWSTSSIYLYRQLFRGLKFLIVFIYFTQVDEGNENPIWKGLGYSGPAPKFSHQTKSPTVDDEDDELQYGPLYKVLAHVDDNPPSTSNLDKYNRQYYNPLLPSRPVDALTHVGLSVKPLAHVGFSNPIPTIYCDAVVVGSGSGGGVVAGVLAKAGYKVVVLEKGDYNARANLNLLEASAMDRMYEGGGIVVTDDMGVVILAGSTVGGGSAINWSASFRTPEHVMSEWRHEHDLELFGSDAYAYAMDVVCERMGVQNQVYNVSLNNAVLRRGCCELGYPVVDVPQNANPEHDCGWCCFGCKNGLKQGTLETWLIDMSDSGNGVIFPSCKALRVLHEDKGRKKNVATGVLFEFQNAWSGKKEMCVVKSKVTVVACGALCTPILLQNSGLRNPNIGKNLHLHPVVMVWGYFPTNQKLDDKENESTTMIEGKRTSYEGAILTAMSTIVSNVETTGYGAVIQTPALHPGMFSAVTPWVSGADFKHRMTRFSRTAHIFALARDKGSGTVDASGSIGYRMAKEDEEHLKRGVEKMLRIMAAAGAEEIGTQHCEGDRLKVKEASSHQFEHFVKAMSERRVWDLSTPICSAHQMGSCRMGVHPGTSVVDQRGETWEVEGLYVADASVLPTALGVNPMVTVQSIAYCTAQAILETFKRKTNLNRKRENNSNKTNNV